MTKSVAVLVLVVLAACAPAVRADGLILKLPEDGTWAVFKSEGYKQRGDKSREPVTGWLRISSVGKATEAGEPCRWIELENSYKTDVGDRRRTEKLLIPEKYLAAGEAPAEHIVRGWSQFDPLPDEGKPHPLDVLDGKPHSRDGLYLLMRPAADATELAPAVVTCKLGEPVCAGRKGTFSVKIKNGDRIGDVNGTFELRRHDDAPFGVVFFQQTITGPDGREAMIKYTLDDFGPTAVSRLPMHQ